ncbi:quaternary ammonium compound efflux SMR transporter SugE [Rhodopirellula sp. MGV]|uniref:quaternary ammonium compound efflux SMR transporter SugE n=1 Tax=Rhodopirellula sp. MGV TaxID=2023130 RepID=UPI000B962F9F|nr:quaternary ammonium compound efflux SMR transporter SugE [Rhodopirellula sp. MGV]OYP36349.1 QacE family quaternary ammonium compound efflux SMR transporter [Rhodopirellula sp. MGV]PNY38419.1 quaternary ammonium compound-resistance protein SugE [Rhodopirellula baltica]
MAWLLLVLAGLFEIVWAVGLKLSDGFSRPIPSLWTIAAMLISFSLLGVSMKTLPVGTAYGVWVGIGTVGTVIVGAIMFGEPASVLRMVFVVLIVIGIVGLKLTSPA